MMTIQKTAVIALLSICLGACNFKKENQPTIKEWNMQEVALTRFLKYISINTQSVNDTLQTPSSNGQMLLVKMLEQELKTMGLSDVSLDGKGYLMATLPANCSEKRPVIGFLAHLDTSPECSGDSIKPSVIENYNGEEIVLNKSLNIILSPVEFPSLNDYIGKTLIVTDGTTLLGSDDKAGVTAIITAIEHLIKHPEIKHGDIRIAFTPDEEVGRGADHFDVAKFGADFAYTIDGEGYGSLEFENFNAASANIKIKGTNVHPGYAKGKMVNAISIANEIVASLPQDQSPETTEGYEGYFHVYKLVGEVESAEIAIIIRDHDRAKFEDKKKSLEAIIAAINKKHNNIVTISISDTYYNMAEKIKPVMHIVDLAKDAMRAVGVEPQIKPIRGGTDGARLSFMGLPCPNIFAGGHNFHSRFEFVALENITKASEVIVEISKVK